MSQILASEERASSISQTNTGKGELIAFQAVVTPINTVNGRPYPSAFCICSMPLAENRTRVGSQNVTKWHRN